MSPSDTNCQCFIFLFTRDVAAVNTYAECVFPQGNLLSNTASGSDEGKDKRDSVQSNDSGIVGDLQECNFDVREQPPVRNSMSAFNRRNAFKKVKSLDRLSLAREKVEVFPGSSPVLGKERRFHTARVVVMGDDRVLGRLTRAYHAIR